MAAMETRENLYAPPRAVELELPADTPDQGRHVELACKLWWIGFALSVLTSLLALYRHTGTPNLGSEITGEVIALAVSLAFVYWFTTKLRAGRNWMRLLVTILGITGFALLGLVYLLLRQTGLAPQFFSEVYAGSPIESVSLIVQFVLSLIELVLINTPSSRAWFKAKKFAG